jgi:hypothetical protein
VGRVVVEMSGVEWPGSAAEEELELVSELSATLAEHDVIRSEALRAAREAEAEALRRRLPELTPAERSQAIDEFEARHPVFGDDRYRLRWQAQELEAQEEAEALLARMPELSRSERISELEAYGDRFWRGSDEFAALHRKIADFDPDTAEAVPPQPIHASPAVPPELLTVAISALTGTVAKQAIDLVIDWVRRRAVRSQRYQQVKIYGADGTVIRSVGVEGDGSITEW